MLVFPSYRDNPFLNLLQLAPRADGFRVQPAHTYDDLVSQAGALTTGDVVHLHWTTPILQQAKTAGDASRRLAQMESLIRRLGTRGVRLVWTVHNRLPHELAFRDLEVRLMQLIADSADAIHIMAPHTPDALADIVHLSPQRIRVIAHPSYEGVYDSSLTRGEARDAFELAEQDRAVLFLGQIRPYKGVDALVSAAHAASESRGDDLVLMLGGAVKEITRDEFAASIPSSLRAITHLDFVPDADIARWFRAADVAVFPYRAILNSGSVHLAATFHVPVLLPGDPRLREQFRDERWVRFFDAERPAESIAELLADDDLFSGVEDADFERFLAPISPWDVSRDYAALLRELTTDSPAALSA